MQIAEKRLETTLVGKYRIQAIVQKGGMGTVFSGRHIELGKKIAIKVLHPQYAENREVTQRFLNEARGTARLQHRNIVDIMDIGTDEEGVPFFVMEFLSGESLKERLVRRSGRLTPAEAADIMVQVLTGLYVAHVKGIVHRDIKPGNIFIARELDGSEVVKILDFGVAKFRELEIEDLHDLTTSGSILGTPSYMSPEQASGKKSEIDYRTDIYSCGVVLYRALTGINPFKGESHYETIQNIVHKKAPRPSELVEDLPEGAEAVVLRAMDRDREKRFDDCRAFIQALEVFYPANGSRPSDFAARVPREISPGQAAERDSRSGVLAAPSRKLKAAVLAAAVLAAVGALLGAAYLLTAKSRGGHGADAGTGAAALQIPTDAQVSTEPDLVTIEFRGLPEGAVIEVDGKRFEGNPIGLARSDRSSTIVITSGGREIFRQDLVPQADERFHIVPAPAEEIPDDTAAKAKPGKKKKKVPEASGSGEKDAGADKKEGHIYKEFPD